MLLILFQVQDNCTALQVLTRQGFWLICLQYHTALKMTDITSLTALLLISAFRVHPRCKWSVLLSFQALCSHLSDGLKHHTCSDAQCLMHLFHTPFRSMSMLILLLSRLKNPVQQYAHLYQMSELSTAKAHSLNLYRLPAAQEAFDLNYCISLSHAGFCWQCLMDKRLFRLSLSLL
ncbi:hypothetical protein MCHI_000688 [Candidatus Magnetoovum chiemensis]|nr:hypothetical protein MCHI_000688 [Candidatus Magnetoovum chiemensis]